MIRVPDIPLPADIVAIREALGLTQGDFGRALGLSDGNAARLVRRWESDRLGEHAPIAGPALAALKYLVAIYEAIRDDDDTYVILNESVHPKLRHPQWHLNDQR